MPLSGVRRGQRLGTHSSCLTCGVPSVWRFNSFFIGTDDSAAADVLRAESLHLSAVRHIRCRDAFVAAPGYVLLVVDYAQIELRLLAHLSGEAAMCAALRCGGGGVDLIRRLAATWLDVDEALVTAEQRSRGWWRGGGFLSHFLRFFFSSFPLFSVFLISSILCNAFLFYGSEKTDLLASLRSRYDFLTCVVLFHAYGC